MTNYEKEIDVREIVDEKMKTFKEAMKLREERLIKEGDEQIINSIASRKLISAMMLKLDKKYSEGRSGWNDKDKVSNKTLSQMLRDHVEKGDPVDVANFCMMIYFRGGKIE